MTEAGSTRRCISITLSITECVLAVSALIEGACENEDFRKPPHRKPDSIGQTAMNRTAMNICVRVFAVNICLRYYSDKHLGLEWRGRMDSCDDLRVRSGAQRRVPLESSSSLMPPSFSPVLLTVPDSITNFSLPPMSYITSQEMKCILPWFAGWSSPQRECFLQDLVAKAVPGKLQPLLDGLEQLSVSGANRPPCIFECQLRLWDQWFQGWAEQERNEFIRHLEISEPDFVAKFYQAVAATAGKD
ncbi:uncharacterized protein C14orf119 homolog [Nycticebus coucang]|uniref:uncharacterized protein C14orf119 homolog n=1 Tax=Nycticebus coucang TaxID=9470 RepID=UPI00234D17D6|nr:uncharacterized protein C14orf119 homolog [Nycticebus coucang]